MTESVLPLNPPAPYLGGKTRLAARIIARIEAIPHKSYVEPFLGMGGIFFRRSSRPKVEIVNDINGDLIAFFRVLQRHPQEFLRTIRFLLTSRETFNTLRQHPRHFLTDIERATIFYYLQRVSFGGMGRNFAAGREEPARFNITRHRTHLDALHARLASVVIENLPFTDILTKYDHNRALFYLDPPYHGHEKDYGRGVFDRRDFARMAKMLYALKGAFILSLNDIPEVRNIFGNFHVEAVETLYTASRTGNKPVTEVIISNREFGKL